MPPKLTELALLKQRLPKLVDDLSVELNKVMQIVTTNADLDVNLEKECFLLQDMHSNCERVVNGLISHDIVIQDKEDLCDIYGDLVTAQKSYCKRL